MRSISISAERQADVQIDRKGKLCRIWIRKDHREDVIENGEQSCPAWLCDEAYMETEPEDCPTVEEVEEDLESWFDYAAGWEAPRVKTNAELQADIEYLALMAGIDMEV